MQNHQAILSVAELLSDAEALTESLLAGDLDEARFRASLISGQARLLGLTDVARDATVVTRHLGGPGERLLPGHSLAVADLSLSLEHALVRALT